MAGGSGKRLWPLSRQGEPKQLLPLFDGRSLLQLAFDRLAGVVAPENVLVCTGAVTLQTRDRLKQIYDQMPTPKFVIAVGTCACTGGIFDSCYCVTGGIDTVVPVDAYIPGCAVRPEAIRRQSRP